MSCTISCIRHGRRFFFWKQKEIYLQIEFLLWNRGSNIGDKHVEISKNVHSLENVVIKRSCQSWKKFIQNVLRKLSFIVNIVSEYCCEGHVFSSIEVKRECIMYMDQFIAFVLNKMFEEYFLFFS